MWKYLTYKAMGINITFFHKNKHIFEGNLNYSLFGNRFQQKLAHIVNWSLGKSIDQFPYDTNFFLKGVFEQTLITATAINYRIVLAIYDLEINSTNQGC